MDGEKVVLQVLTKVCCVHLYKTGQFSLNAFLNPLPDFCFQWVRSILVSDVLLNHMLPV